MAPPKIKISMYLPTNVMTRKLFILYAIIHIINIHTTNKQVYTHVFSVEIVIKSQITDLV